MIKVEISIELVESLINHSAEVCGSVLLLELKDSMELLLVQKLMEGRVVSLRSIFEACWGELVDESPEISLESTEYDIGTLTKGC